MWEEGTKEDAPYPVFLEAVLGAEEATLDTQAQALGALEGTGIVFAISAEALLLRGGLLGHGGGASIRL